MSRLRLSETMVTQGDGVLEGDALSCGVDQVLITELLTTDSWLLTTS
ncbi:hypothetical protein [Nocardia sp. NPDC005998]